MAKKKNCWEYMQCGREPGGLNADEKGVCPAALDQTHDGINSGSCAGRFCWAVAGTLCGGKIQGTFAEKRDSCTQCLFYKQVRAEEGSLNIRTKFLRFVRPYSKSSFFRNLVPARIRQGCRFILQGKPTDTACIIQQGSCILLVEKKDGLYPVGHRGEGDIVGMISLLTGEPSGFHVEAETDMDVWGIGKEDVDQMPDHDPELFAFLTELVADRFDRKGPMAERAIGKYLITDILGRGGYSIVYKGIHAGLERPVAIKMMRHHFSMQPEFLRRFQNEAKIIAGLNHDNIVRIFDIESRYKTVFIVYEFLEGEPLTDLIGRLKKIPPLLAHGYLRQMVSAMAYAAGKGLIHRDINPSNVMVLPNDRIKLIDFGLAGPIGAEDFEMDGNFNYMAPEILDGEPADFRSDIFSLGLTAFHMVMGRLPYVSDNPAERMKMMRAADIPDPGKSVENLPKTFHQFILKACKKDPDQRFQTMKEAEDFLFSGKPENRKPPVRSDRKISGAFSFEIHEDRYEELSVLLDKFNGNLSEISTEEMAISARTDIGLKRKTNQDRYGIRVLPDGTVLMALADGLGGDPGGEIASGHVMEKMKEAAVVNLVDFFYQMDREIASMTEGNEALSGMATTLIVVAIKNHRAVWAHSGDSRLYHFGNQNLTQITQDQTLARFLVSEGELSDKEAGAHYSRNVLEQYIGCRDLRPETGEIRLESGDMLILMSDGVYRSMDKKTMKEILEKAETCSSVSEQLIQLSMDTGGNDNITAVVAKIH